MKLAVHDICNMLVGIAKPWEDTEVFAQWEDRGAFAQSHFGTDYWLHVYVSPDRVLNENNTTYYIKLYCEYTLSKLNMIARPIKKKEYKLLPRKILNLSLWKCALLRNITSVKHCQQKGKKK